MLVCNCQKESTEGEKLTLVNRDNKLFWVYGNRCVCPYCYAEYKIIDGKVLKRGFDKKTKKYVL